MPQKKKAKNKTKKKAVLRARKPVVKAVVAPPESGLGKMLKATQRKIRAIGNAALEKLGRK